MSLTSRNSDRVLSVESSLTNWLNQLKESRKTIHTKSLRISKNMKCLRKKRDLILLKKVKEKCK